MPFGQIESGLRKIQQKRYKKCSTIEELENLLQNNQSVLENFAKFRGEIFYRGTVTDEVGKACIFVLESLRKFLEDNGGFDMHIDGTFSIVPLQFKQLLILIANINGRVSYRSSKKANH